MVVAYEHGREGGDDHVVSVLGCGSFILDILYCFGDGILRVGAGHGAVNEVVEHIYNYKCNVFHLLVSLYFYGSAGSLEFVFESLGEFSIGICL